MSQSTTISKALMQNSLQLTNFIQLTRGLLNDQSCSRQTELKIQAGLYVVP